jgi:hypothetical protein
MSTMDYNVDTYTISELLAIVNLDDPSEEEIIDTTNTYIDRFTEENSTDLVTFFQDIQTKLLQYTNELQTSGKDAEYEPNTKQTDEWFKFQALPQNNAVQKDKNTDRIQKIDVYDNNHVPMNREQLGVANNINVPIAQDTLNPNLENIITRFINLDSQYRQSAGGFDTMSTDYTLNLSDQLKNVLTLRLYSIQIPFTWYVIDNQYGNTCFWVTNTSNVDPTVTNTFKIFIPPGNYSTDSFCVAINEAFTTLANFEEPFVSLSYLNPFTHSSPIPSIATYNPNNGKITLNLEGWNDPAGYPIVSISQTGDTFDATTDPYFTFFDFTGKLNCLNDEISCAVENISFDGTLGWLMGFRLPIIPIFSTPGNTAIAVLDLYGPKYFILVIDDYNQNHINNGLVTITDITTKLSIPSYYNTSQPYICSSAIANVSSLSSINTVGNLSTMSSQAAAISGFNQINIINSLQDKLNLSYTSQQTILPSAPRTLTQAQIYTINEISKNREKNTSYRAKAPTCSDSFALIPIKRGGLSIGDIYTEFSGSMQDNKRIYFGPVDIDRMRIRLLDDRGFVVDLHGVDWCVTLISENLYQY